MPFLDDYEPVETRIDKFYGEHPDGRIITELVSYDGEQWVFKASVFREGGAPPAATGFAHEVTTQRGVNATSACENCETSAIGRALANLNYAAKGKRPSRQEMRKTQPQRSGTAAGPTHSGTAASATPTARESAGAPAAAPFTVGEATLHELTSRASALLADHAPLYDSRKAWGLPKIDEHLTDEQVERWRKLLTELETNVTVSKIVPA